MILEVVLCLPCEFKPHAKVLPLTAATKSLTNFNIKFKKSSGLIDCELSKTKTTFCCYKQNYNYKTLLHVGAIKMRRKMCAGEGWWCDGNVSSRTWKSQGKENCNAIIKKDGHVPACTHARAHSIAKQ